MFKDQKTKKLKIKFAFIRSVPFDLSHIITCKNFKRSLLAV